MSESLNLVKVPLRYAGLVAIAKRRGIPLRDLDDGYLVHCVLREIWQDAAPAPFVLRSRGRALDAWGYSDRGHLELQEHARAFADPELVTAIDDLEGIVSKAMPEFRAGMRAGFHLRASPVVRLSSARGEYRAGAELDAYQVRCLVDGADAPSREAVYRDWLSRKLSDPKTGVEPSSIRLAAHAREALVRRTQGAQRQTKRLERPIACFEGELIVKDGALFRQLLTRGVGRHRGFGFGALVLAAPGTPYPRS